MNAQPYVGFESREIQVSGLSCFSINQWRNAVYYFLTGIWADNGAVTYRPKICFDSVTLRLDLDTSQYLVYGRGYSPLPNMGRYYSEQILEVGSEQFEVEAGLIRFAKNDRVRVLVVDFGDSRLFLYKGRKRGVLNIATQDVPREWNGLCPI